MLAARVATALALLAVIIPTLIWLPPVAWAWLTLLFMVAAIAEWLALCQAGRWAWPVALGCAALAAAWLAASAALPMPLELALLSAAGLFWVFLAPRWLRRVRPGAAARWLGPPLLAACWIGLIRLRAHGVDALITAMAIVWLADIGAYFVGKAIGRRKLAPRVSPGKTLEGAAGGMLLVVVGGLVAAAAPGLANTLPALLVGHGGPVLAVLVLGVLVALSIVGDLLESLLKRAAGAKDSGHLLPGHGGVLDRIDALLPTVPLMALLHLWMTR